MRYDKLGASGLEVSELALGTITREIRARAFAKEHGQREYLL